VTDDLYIPKTLHEALKHFANPDVAHNFMVSLRWPDGVTCPNCEGKEHSYISTRRTWACKGCKTRFTVKKGSIMEDSPLSIELWLAAMWLISGAKNGISSCEIARSLGICQKSAWFLLHRIRHVMSTGSMDAFVGEIEVDETFIGGLEKNKHSDKKLKAGRGSVGKDIVMGILERATNGQPASQIRTKVFPDTGRETLHAEIKASVAKGSTVYTDAHRGYRGMPDGWEHQWVDHAVSYVEGNVHTNGCENFWSLFDRMLHGTYTHIDPQHLQAYADEMCYRFNNRKGVDGERFAVVAASTPGKRLTFKQLTERGLTLLVD
jgi:transposase-like protein